VRLRGRETAGRGCGGGGAEGKRRRGGGFGVEGRRREVLEHLQQLKKKVLKSKLKKNIF
jgi:hypothetical protein